MAKKSARREPDPDLEDEELELEESDDAPPRKKGSGKLDKKSTGKRKAEDPKGSSSVSKKALSSSGKRKVSTGSHKRPSHDDDDGEEVTSSARRKRAAPPAKKKDNTVLIVSIVSMTLLLLVGVIVVNKRRTPKENRNEQVEYEAFKKLWDEGNGYFREFNAAEKAGNAALAKAKWKASHDKLTAAVEALEKVLADKRDPNTQMLPKEYEGYEEDLQKIALLIVDLEKRSTQ